ncbi:hypothetical protein L917_15879 [Phytophthora nicotianae]|nr:hypothetical protein L917_15879 [Phytophthora nicotianae]
MALPLHLGPATYTLLAHPESNHKKYLRINPPQFFVAGDNPAGRTGFGTVPSIHPPGWSLGH